MSVLDAGAGLHVGPSGSTAVTDGKEPICHSDRMNRSPLRKIVYVSLFLATAVLGWEATHFDLYHEEPRRLLVAVSMLENGEWLVPHVLGDVYLRKPPGFNWVIALFSLPFGTVNEWVARLVSVCSWGISGMLIFYLSRDLAHDRSRMFSVLSFLLCGTVFVEKAALAEIDLFFTTLLTAGVASWLYYYRRGQELIGWLLGHLLLGLALLTKGPVAYLFFYSPIAGFCFFDDRHISVRKLLAGVLLGHLLVMAWLFGFFQHVSLTEYLNTMYSELFQRGARDGVGEYVKMLLTYPLRVFIGFLPWGLALFALFVSNVRNRIFEKFGPSGWPGLLVGGGLAFLPFWLFPADSTRYVLPLYPWAALAAGLCLDGLIEEDRLLSFLSRLLTGLGGFFVVGSAATFLVENEAGLLSMGHYVAAFVLIVFSGLYMILSARYFRTRFTALLSGFILFVFVVKMVYILVFVPAAEPERLSVRKSAQTLAKKLDRDGGNLPVLLQTDQGLGIAYYLKKQGIHVRAKTNSAPEPSYVIAGESFENTSDSVRVMTVHVPGRDPVYVFKSR